MSVNEFANSFYVPHWSAGCESTQCQWIAVGVCIFIWVTTIPFLIHIVSKYYRYRYFPCMMKRYPSIIAGMTWLLIIFIGFERSIYPLSATNFFNPLWFRASYLVIFCICIHFVVYLALLKYWMTFYDIGNARALAQNQWKQIIDDKLDFEHNFFIQNKDTLGNVAFVFRYIILPLALISTIVSYFSFIYLSDLASFIDSILLCIPLILISVIWLKTPAFDDVFKIRNEARRFLISSIILLVFYTAEAVIEALFFESNEIRFVSVIVNAIGSSFGMVIGAWQLTEWVVNKNIIHKNIYHINKETNKRIILQPSFQFKLVLKITYHLCYYCRYRNRDKRRKSATDDYMFTYTDPNNKKFNGKKSDHSARRNKRVRSISKSGFSLSSGILNFHSNRGNNSNTGGISSGGGGGTSDIDRPATPGSPHDHSQSGHSANSPNTPNNHLHLTSNNTASNGNGSNGKYGTPTNRNLYNNNLDVASSFPNVSTSHNNNNNNNNGSVSGSHHKIPLQNVTTGPSDDDDDEESDHDNTTTTKGDSKLKVDGISQIISPDAGIQLSLALALTTDNEDENENEKGNENEQEKDQENDDENNENEKGNREITPAPALTNGGIGNNSNSSNHSNDSDTEHNNNNNNNRQSRRNNNESPKKGDNNGGNNSKLHVLVTPGQDSQQEQESPRQTSASPSPGLGIFIASPPQGPSMLVASNSNSANLIDGPGTSENDSKNDGHVLSMNPSQGSRHKYTMTLTRLTKNADYSHHRRIMSGPSAISIAAITGGGGHVNLSGISGSSVTGSASVPLNSHGHRRHNSNNNSGHFRVISKANVRLTDIIIDKKCLPLFISHLSSEFSIENIVSVIEFTQYQMYILQQWMYVGNVIDDTDEMEDTSEAVDPFTEVLDLPSDTSIIPQSSIIRDIGNLTIAEMKLSENFDQSKTMQGIMKRKVLTIIKIFFDKYIIYGSPYELNIAYNLREEMLLYYNIIKKSNCDWDNIIDMKQKLQRKNSKTNRNSLSKDGNNKNISNPSAQDGDGNNNNNDDNSVAIVDFDASIRHRGSSMTRTLSRGIESNLKSTKSDDFLLELKWNDIIHIFDQTILAVSALMMDSLNRFKQTKEFRRWLKQKNKDVIL